MNTSLIIKLLHRHSSIVRSLSTAVATTKKGPLEDAFGRRHDYLRISLTEKCNLRCRYCMPEEGIQLSPQNDLLNINELKRLSSIFVKSCSVTKIRLTGGEPTIDKKLIPLMEHLNTLRSYGLDTIAITTNGLTLKKHAPIFKQLGLNGLNISLDTLREERFELMTRRKGYKLVRDGLRVALDERFDSVKLNCVIMKGFNDDELIDFAELALRLPLEVRFIEFMPFAGNRWSSESMLTYKEMLNIISSKYPDLELSRASLHDGSTSKIFKHPNWMGSIGFISSMSDNFCSTCNRVRITSDGNLKVCLFGREETSLKDLIRCGATDEEIISSIESALHRKKRQHADQVASAVHQSIYNTNILAVARRSYSSSPSRAAAVGQQEEPIFSHLTETNDAKMVNVGAKKMQKRIAVAKGRIFVGSLVLTKLKERQTIGGKGDVLTVSRVAGIMGAKLTSNLIPLCHQIPLDCVDISLKLCEESQSLLVEAKVEATHKTGVEMESLTAVSVTLLTIYDMCKSVNKSTMAISDIKLISKTKEMPSN